MKREELLQARDRFEAFVEPLLPLLGRQERRRWGAFYLQGLLLEGGRKTAAGMAERYGGDEQCLQQFVNQSPWDWMPVREQLARETVRHASTQAAWVVDDTGFPKKGRHSVGVARQYSGTLGKVGNCQVAVSLNYATDEGCFPLDFQLYLPEAWTKDADRRRRAGIPETVIFKRKWQLALEMIDRARQWGIVPGIVVTDSGYGVVSEFRAALRARELSYCVGLTREVKAWSQPVDAMPPPYQGRGRPRTRPRDLPAPQSLLEIAQGLPAEAWREVCWRKGSKGWLKSRFAAVRVQPSHGHSQGKLSDPVQWLLIQWPMNEAEPTHYWFSNLLDDTSLRQLVYWAKIRWWVEQNYEQLKEELGLDHFEGRSWTGWYHHVTLCMIAFNFLVLEGFRGKKNFWVDPPKSPPGAAADPVEPAWFLPDLQAPDSPP